MLRGSHCAVVMSEDVVWNGCPVDLSLSVHQYDGSWSLSCGSLLVWKSGTGRGLQYKYSVFSKIKIYTIRQAGEFTDAILIILI